MQWLNGTVCKCRGSRVQQHSFVPFLLMQWKKCSECSRKRQSAGSAVWKTAVRGEVFENGAVKSGLLLAVGAGEGVKQEGNAGSTGGRGREPWTDMFITEGI